MKVDEDSSHAARILLLFYVMLSLTLCGGTVFGYAGLKEVLLDEGVYRELCRNSDDQVPCNEQMLRLDLMFTLASSLFSAYLLPAGLCLQKIGPRYSFFLGFFLVFTGSILFVAADSKTFDVYIPAFVAIGTGNPLLYISSFNFSKLYPSSSNLLLSMFIGCFGFSAIVFYIFQEVHFAYGVPSNQLFLLFSLVPIALVLCGFCLLPVDVYHVQRQKKLAFMNGDTDVVGEKTPLLAIEATPKEPVELPSENEGILQQLKSPQFLAQAIFFSWGMLHLNFYLGTVYDQLLMFDKTGGDKADQITEFFALSYPFGCLASILPVGLLVRNTSVSTSIFVYCTANLIFSGFSLVPQIGVQWFTVNLFIVDRVAFFTVMSTYSAAIFGFKNLSTMFGAAGCIAGLASLLSYLLSYIALDINNDFTAINTVLFVGALVNFAFPTLIRKYWEEEKGEVDVKASERAE